MPYFDTDENALYTPPSKNPLQKGTVSWTFGSSSGLAADACANENELRENYCSGIPNGLRLTESVDCAQVGLKNFPDLDVTWKCVDGACKSPSPMNVSMNQTKPQNVTMNQTKPMNVSMNETKPPLLEPMNKTMTNQTMNETKLQNVSTNQTSMNMSTNKTE